MVNLLERLHRDIKHYPIGLKSYDKSGKKTTYDADLKDDHRVDITDILSSKKDDTGGGNTTPDVPTAGADYYAGSLADGEITERYLLYQRDESVAEKTGPQTVGLLRDVGSKFNMAGDGATFLIHLQKTVMTKGAKGAVTDIELNYDPNNVAKDGYFTTTSPYPVYTKSADLATKKTLAIPINGIGENLNGKNVKAPQLNILFNGDGTMTFESVTGYDNDGDSTGATGANYDVIVDVIATFSTQPAVAQMPASVNFFNGSTNSNVALSGVNDFYENTMDGIEITFDKFAYDSNLWLKIDLDAFGLKRTVRIPKEDLIVNAAIPQKYDIPKDQSLYIYQRSGSNASWTTDPNSQYKEKCKVGNKFEVYIYKNSIKVECNYFTSSEISGTSTTEFFSYISKVTPYKN